MAELFNVLGQAAVELVQWAATVVWALVYVWALAVATVAEYTLGGHNG